jgi:DNA-binding CsgD family transcriptional regulator
VIAEADAAHNDMAKLGGLQGLGYSLACQGDVSGARAAGQAALEAAYDLGEYFLGFGYAVLSMAALAAGDVQTAQDASEATWRAFNVAQPRLAAAQRGFNGTEAALATGDLISARRWADDAVSAGAGWFLAVALISRARVAIAEGNPEEAERDARDALACAADTGAHVAVPDAFECLAGLASDAGSHQEAARLFGAAEAFRQRIGLVRYLIHQGRYEASVAALREAMGKKDFDAAWAEGAALSTEEAIAYAQRGRGERKRPATGWASLTPAERDVVRLVSEGLANNDVATRLFVSPRTVQAHLTHVYSKLGITSRMQLAQEAARHA